MVHTQGDTDMGTKRVFPSSGDGKSGSTRRGQSPAFEEQGISLRDYAACQAVVGILSSSSSATPTEAAFQAYQVADEMLRVREEPTGE